MLAKLGGSQLSNTPDDYSVIWRCVLSGGDALWWKGMTPLLWAAQGGHWECIEALCENYSDLDVTDRNVGTPQLLHPHSPPRFQGQTALHIACRALHYELARVLLEHQCNPNVRDASLVPTPPPCTLKSRCPALG